MTGRLILIAPNHSFPSAVARFGVAATYSGTPPGCLPGRSGDAGSTHEVVSSRTIALEAAGLSHAPAADLGRV